MRRDHNKVPTAVDANTLLLLHGNEFVDASLVGASVSNVGGVEIVSNGYFDKAFYWGNSTNGYIQCDIGTSNKITNKIWTLDLWLKPTSSNLGYKVVADFCNHSIMYFDIADNRDGTMAIMGGGGQNWNVNGKLWPNPYYVDFTVNEWVHIAIVADGTTNYYFKNGILRHSTPLPMVMNNGLVRFGNIALAGYSRYFRGYMSEIRLSKVARWTANFTPPTAPY